jgi:hypothetical protein
MSQLRVEQMRELLANGDESVSPWTVEQEAEKLKLLNNVKFNF